jgi:hypothetical protein
MIFTVKKFGQVTQVYLNDNLIYVSGNTVKAEMKNLNKLIEATKLLAIVKER